MQPSPATIDPLVGHRYSCASSGSLRNDIDAVRSESISHAAATTTAQTGFGVDLPRRGHNHSTDRMVKSQRADAPGVAQHRAILTRYRRVTAPEVPIRVVVRPGQAEAHAALLAQYEVCEHDPTVADLDGFAAEVEAADRGHLSDSARFGPDSTGGAHG